MQPGVRAPVHDGGGGGRRGCCCCDIIIITSEPRRGYYRATRSHREREFAGRARCALAPWHILRVEGGAGGADAQYGERVGPARHHGEYGVADRGVDGAGAEGVGSARGGGGVSKAGPDGEVRHAGGGGGDDCLFVSGWEWDG